MKVATRILVGIAILLAIGLLTSAPKSQASDIESAPSTQVFISEAVTPVLSRPVREIESQKPDQVLNREINPIRNPGLFMEDMGLPGSNTTGQDPLANLSRIFTGLTPNPIFTFEGLGTDGFTPPDTVGEVGPNHYIQMVNVSFAIFDKSGNVVQGDTPFTALFSGSGLTECSSQNDGDPIVVWDSLADRWLLSQFAVSSTPEHMCIAISQTPDPTGAYYLYQFAMPDFPDYFKFGVWPDAYYMGTNTGFPNQYYAYAFDRVSMLAGQSATYQYSSGHPNFLMPADLDGPSAPPAGSPGYFYTMLAEGYPNHPAGVDRVVLYEFDVDWAVPSNSTFGIAQEIPIADYNYTVCGFFVGDCIPQPGTAQGIDSLSYWPMWRFAYRNLNSYEAMVGNFTVDVDGTDRAAIRWFELQNDGTSWSLHQEGTLAPDSDHRFMGSIAMDGSGNIALGYSVSSATTFPSIRYATRLRSDPLGTLQAEATMYDGSGSQTGIHRWGDYSSMSVDPADECTFWYTNEYHDVNDSGWNWNTRVGTFRLPECSGTIGADFTIAAEPAELSICTPDNAVYDVTVQYYTGYNSQVNLSASGLPAGATATFVPSSVITPTTASVLTIGTTGTTPGFYNVDIVGVGVPTPTHTTTVGLDLYGAVPGAVPLVSPADTATNVDLVPTFEWDTATQGGSYFLEVAEDSGFVTVVYSNTVAGLSDTPTIALTPLSTYYWRVTSTNACGVGSASAVYSFTTRDIPPILLVDDDDNGPDARAPYIAALDSAGAMYDIWDTGNSDNEPSLTDLLPYSTVIWFTGDEFGGAAGPGSAGEAALGSWLDGGKCLFLSGQDYYYDRGLTTFMTNYLGLASATNDNGDYTSVTGQNTVFGGLGPYSLTYPFTDYSDPVTPDSTAEVGFVGNNSNNAALTKDSGVYRTTFWAFPFEALSAANGLEVMTTVLNWCGSGADTGTLQGNVSSSVTATGIEGATVTAVDGSYQRTISTNAAGDYSMVVPVGTYDITAAATNYVSDTVTSVAVMTDTVVTVDFVLDGSVLTYSPEFIEEYMEIGDVVTNTVTVTNTGPLPIDFSVNIGNYGGSAVVVPSSVMPIDGSPVVVAPEAQEAPSTAGLTLPEAPVAQQLAAGDVIQSWTPTGMVGPWGIAFDGTDVWVSSPAPAWGGDNTLHEFSANGTPTGVVHNYTWNPSNGPGDATYNWNTGKLWVMNINSGVSNCIYEMDPATGFTGNTICPGGSTGFTTSQRGLAYDPATDTYLAGSWNDQTVYRFAPDGTILEQVVVGLDISGLAYNPDTMHLFAMVNASPNPVYVLDAANNYATVGQFNISQDFGDFSGAGLEFDCTGNLWAVDQVTAQVYQVESGETASLCGGANNWAYAVPDSGTIPANSVSTFDVVFDATSFVTVGDFTAELTFDGTFVNEVPTMPLTMHLSCPTCGILDGSITDAVTGDPLEASIHVTSTAGFDVTLNGNAYSLAVQPGDYNFTVDADGYLPETATATASAGMTVTTDFALTPEYGELYYSPAAIEEFMVIGDVVTNTVTVTNSGNTPMDWSVSISNYQGPGTLQVKPITVTPLPVPEALHNGTAYDDADFDPSLIPSVEVVNDGSPAIYMADLIFYADRAVFDVDNPDLPVEDFEEGNVAAGGVTTCVAPINSNSNDACFAPGDILPGVDLQDDPGPEDMVVLGSGVIGNLSKIVGPNTFTDFFDIYFTEDVNAVGLDVLSNNPGVAVPINIYGTGGVLLGTSSVTPSSTGVFWGVRANEPITRISIQSADGELIDNFAFGLISGVSWATAVPDSGTIPANSVATFEVVFDSTALTMTGDYTADLTFAGTFANEVPVMPLTMHLIDSVSYGVEMSLDTHDLSGAPGETVTATMTMTNTGNANDTYDMVLTSNWPAVLDHPMTISMAPGEVATMHIMVTIPMTATDGMMDTVEMTVTSEGDSSVSASGSVTVTAVLVGPEDYLLYLPVIMKP